ncbi:MAE_28990/MAE_18760 family HEPN-like nuclease [uncultured Xanthomonas sp.]|uniref:MAE_28990/MAE_18760 family HEPN-like nuclease n=1 Tax=uncultured Xanthomonas sp. TaxID=152831 RepID=UPI0025F0667C|nr:MAE_28990/MAE_18760 family HEPN-like nuclease [uncultured Xanthomonas sp.]
MSPRTEGALYQHLDHEMAWRIKEIHALRRAVSISTGRAADVHVRAGVALLYAHWEGFVKSSANAYVGYLANRGDLGKDLKSCFIAMSMKARLGEAIHSSKAAPSISVIDFFSAEIDKPINLPKKDAVSAQDNLNSDVLKNICAWIGIDSSKYEPRSNLIDERLLKNRNGIAHGDRLLVDSKGYFDLVDKVLEMMRWFKTDIENAVSKKEFLRGAAVV